MKGIRTINYPAIKQHDFEFDSNLDYEENLEYNQKNLGIKITQSIINRYDEIYQEFLNQTSLDDMCLENVCLVLKELVIYDPRDTKHFPKDLIQERLKIDSKSTILKVFKNAINEIGYADLYYDLSINKDDVDSVYKLIENY